MRTIDLLGKILGQGCHAEILENTAAGLLLVVKAENSCLLAPWYEMKDSDLDIATAKQMVKL